MRVDFEGVTIEMREIGKLSPQRGWTIGAHKHTSYELHFVTEGGGTNRLASGGELELCPNMLYLAPPDETHAQTSHADNPLGLYYAHFFISAAGSERPLPRIFAPFPFLSGQFDAVYEHFFDSRTDKRFRARLRAVELIWSVVQPYVRSDLSRPLGHAGGGSSAPSAADSAYPQRFDETVVPDDGGRTGHHLLEQALLYIQSHFLRNPTVAEVAAACYVSERHLNRLYQKHLGLSAHDVIQRERIRWAIAQLSQPCASVQYISEQLHVRSMSYFSSWFRQWTGMTPIECKRAASLRGALQ